jgi:prepilin-type N-terminal cleavage/methylation domain-containing protein
MKKINCKGFTLIELLVVIAIIGILASIVMAFLGNQNKRAADKKTQQQISSLRSQAQLYSGATGTVVAPSTAAITTGTNLFNDPSVVNNSLRKLITGLPSGTAYYYAWDGASPSGAGRWFVAATLSTGTTCADWSGATKNGSTVVTTPASVASWSAIVNAATYSCL